MLHNEITSEKKREMFKVNYVQAVNFVYAWVRDKLKAEIGVRVEVHERRFYCSLIVGDILRKKCVQLKFIHL